MFSAVRACLGDQSLTRSLSANLVAGLTVGVVALPLSMGLAIASGVPPQHGLYTAIVGGIVIALAGGSRVNVSGPTAAFVVVLLPIVHDFGLGGLLLAGALAGLMAFAAEPASDEAAPVTDEAATPASPLQPAKAA